MIENKNLKDNMLLNFIKGLGCIGVVFIHVKFPGLIGNIVAKISQFAVPIFLMTSGYFVRIDEENYKIIIKRRLSRIVNITFFSMILYLGYTIIVNIINNNLKLFFIGMLSFKQIIKWIVISDFDYFNAGHLWFLPSLLYCYVFVYCCPRIINKFLNKLALFLILVRVLVCILTQYYDLSWHIRGNFFVAGLPWFLLGLVIYNNKKVTMISNKVLFLSCFVGLIFAIIFEIENTNVDFSEAGIIVLSLSLFILAIKNSTLKISKYIEYIGKQLSLYVYVIHVLIFYILNKFFSRIQLIDNNVYLWTRPLIVLFISIFVGFSICKVRKIYIRKLK